MSVPENNVRKEKKNMRNTTREITQYIYIIHLRLMRVNEVTERRTEEGVCMMNKNSLIHHGCVCEG